MEPNEIQGAHLAWAHEFFQLVTQDVTPEQARWQPPGTANPLGAVLAHAVITEDVGVQIILAEEKPLFAGDWEGQTGISDLEPRITPEWAESVEIDLEAFRRYMKAVFARSEEVVAGLTAQDLEREIDLTEMGMGIKTGHQVLAELIVSHLNNMIGEIAVLKGLQGAQGYPF